MSFGRSFIIAALFLAANGMTASSAAKRPAATWNYYYFDGRAFVAGQQFGVGRFVALREQMVPVVETGTARLEAVALSHGKGAIVGICYIQSSGGKLAPSSTYTPVPQSPVRIFFGSELVATIQTDEHGYFTAQLDAGKYTLESGAIQIKVLIENGITKLVPMRIGKRMVD